MNLLINWVISALTIIATAYLLPGVHVEGFTTALVVAVVLGAINIFIKPILIILTLPINILSLGLFTFVINAVIILIVSKIVPGFKVDSFISALLFSIILSIINSVLHR